MRHSSKNSFTTAERGFLSGDASYNITTDIGQVGIITLNSTWLQLSTGDYEGELHVDARQILSICKNDVDSWTNKHTANLLITHQPASWLHKNSPSTWDNDINPTGRFDFHLFGHMHEPQFTSISHGGGRNRRSIQSASLFGLETFGPNEIQRIQGYSIGSISKSTHKKTFTCWPRLLEKMADGRMKLVPDHQLDLDEGSGSFSFEYDNHGDADRLDDNRPETVEVQSLNLCSQSNFDLQQLRYALNMNPAHRRVRQVEHRACVDSLRGDRVSWLNAVWGMGHEGFLGSLLEEITILPSNVYRLDFEGFNKPEIFFDSVHARLGNSFQEVCTSIADAGPSLVIFDGVEIGTDVVHIRRIVAEIERIATTLADFAPEAFVVIRTHPNHWKYQ
jgi:hypothetical protein